MSDPLNDPRFPDRPQHPDFWKLSEIALRLDGKANEGGQTMPEIVTELSVVDLASLEYLALNRAGTALLAIGMPLENVLQSMLAAAMVDGFTIGVLFERQRGASS